MAAEPSHREKVLETLIDAADNILRSSQKLTAAEVSSSACIARNSIYRYVDSVDDLRGLVLARYVPAWEKAIVEALKEIDDPIDRLVVWLDTNLCQAKLTGHNWLMNISHMAKNSNATKDVARFAHRVLWGELDGCWKAIVKDEADARRWSFLTLGLLQNAFGQVEREYDFDRLRELVRRSGRALAQAAQRDQI
ncbi:TetR/AcrR family transcriptional regulator [Propionimicrobium lymphophilum]|uniref:HTH tetR-type domain-containing protein n=1 Tax=Propionimicrobium lymphophilum ACS-093-V-SCH5 TaxID=883161 RepID=S2WJK9_9ACTN|nr:MULTISPECIES: hypothetical protein [Propionimicrobium]EPD32822.1 hypothetical protein HMPREF9306_01129 [Propionimicrobium lymphophilum ACS-093-V-SCH5]ETJ98343.1 hypothetical protein HMPREF1255_1560 [Propionimicrobium sp. BV2F7]MDK7710268.1 TetR/AcrR family transcriptional regulator [Propionimicrobium lymphophilum]MDK7734283.1 TetR/AcrR family transcriptional regulator [Propionimicrobium lymphophilum]